MGKFLRFIGIFFMSLTAAFTILGGVGTTCVALAAEKYDSMVGIAPYKWLYVLFVLVTTAIGVLGVRAVVQLVRGRSGAYRYAMMVLIAGVVVGVAHILTSRALRGSSMPVDAVVYTTVLTLVIFLLFRLPGVWQKVDWERAKKGEAAKTGGAAAIIMGVLCLTIQFWMGSTHTFGGINYADAFHAAMTAIGVLLAGLGAGLLLTPMVKRLLHLSDSPIYEKAS